jgi:hypothetical protein
MRGSGHGEVNRGPDEPERHHGGTTVGSDLPAPGMPEQTVADGVPGQRPADPSRKSMRFPRLQRELDRLNQLGAGLGVVALFLSLTPSLLP